ncbi:MAG: prolyl oligopeptidase family serine peptidase [Candidatus Heimdallarchaeota archaeon]|nr:prolyl oligopeptidase family serine peptidase [Candidatus Heimdallarchaeota archaeon]
MNYADQVKAPLLLVHGKNDPRCPVTESTNFADALRKHGYKEGVDFELDIPDDEGHLGLFDIEKRIRNLEINLDFIKRHLLS